MIVMIETQVTIPRLILLVLIFLFMLGVIIGGFVLLRAYIDTDPAVVDNSVYPDPHVTGDHLVSFTIYPETEGLTLTAKTDNEPTQISTTNNESQAVISMYPLKKYTVKIVDWDYTVQLYPRESHYILWVRAQSNESVKENRFKW